MELWCGEVKVDPCPRAEVDPVVTRDPRVMQRLIAAESRRFRHMTSRCYFRDVQDELEPHMRRTVAKWMLEVCEEEGCEDVVFPLAMSYMDRFLSTVKIRKAQLQLLGTVCLMLASKLRQCRAFTIDQLIYYTDYSVTAKEITTWELLVLSRLNWDISTVIANDFVDPLLSRLPVDQDVVRRHANTFIALCATEYKFSSYPPSLLATASVAAAINGLPWLRKPWSSLVDLLEILHELTDMNTDCIRCCIEDIEALVSVNIARLHQTVTKTSVAPSGGSKINCTLTNTGGTQSQPETPTDVQDVLF